MSEEFKCPYCEGTASIAYHRTGNNLLYCKDCKRTFSERDAKIMKQAARIAELEKENREQLIDYENRLCEARKYQQGAIRRCEELEAERDRLREALNLIGTKADFCADECEYGPDATSFRLIADDAKRALKGAEQEVE